MTQEVADKFAAALLKQNGREKEFNFELPEEHNLDLVENALVRAGCQVDRHPDGLTVTVRVPDALQITS